MFSGRAIVLLIVAAFGIRLLSLLWLASPPPALDADSLWYHLSAVGLFEGRGYVHHFTGAPTAAWPPGYPAILAVVYRLFGADASRALVLNALAGTMTCWLTGRLAKTFVSERAGVVATAVMAFAPSQILLTSLVLTETIFTTMMTALVLAAAVLLQSTKPARTPVPAAATWLIWGAAVGIAGLVRAEAVLLLFAPVATLLLGRSSQRAAASIAVLVIAGSLAAQLPWLIRNAHVFGRIVPASTSFGRTMLIGHNPIADGGMNLYSPDPAADQHELYAGGPEAELRVDNRLRDAAIRFAKENPARELRLVPLRLAHLYRGDRVWSVWYPGDSPAHVTESTVENLGRASNVYYWLLLAAALPAFVRFCRVSDPAQRLVPLLIVIWSAFYAVILYGSERFHVPLMPLFAVLAAATLTTASHPRKPNAAVSPS